jgi:Fic/DOC family
MVPATNEVHIVHEFILQSSLIEDILVTTEHPLYKGHLHAIEAALRAVEKLSGNAPPLVVITGLHNVLMTSEREACPGLVRAENASYGYTDFPRPEHIQDLLEHWLAVWQGILDGVHARTVVFPRDARERLAWRIHDIFMCIHPFSDGNGRLGRIILNMVRRQLGLSWMVVKCADRDKYFTKLRKYERWKYRPEHLAMYPAPRNKEGKVIF